MSDKPCNILWFCTDQQRYDTIHALGNPYIDTPNLDRLCREGVAFTQAYVQNPVCTPSRASFLSGKYPSAINANVLGAYNGPEHCTLITKALADHGYHCGNIGKLHLTTAWDCNEERCDDGYSEFLYCHDTCHDQELGVNAYREWLEKKGIDWHDLFEMGGSSGSAENDKVKKSAGIHYREDAPEELRQTAWCAEAASEFIRRNSQKEEPWLLSVNCFDPHPPFDAPKMYVNKYLDRHLPEPIFNDTDYLLSEQLKDVYHQTEGLRVPDEGVRRDKASYYGMCELIDTYFGKIIDTLDEMGLRENTLIIYTSDHGEMLGDHGLIHKGCRFYDGAVRVPLIFSMPSKVICGKRVENITELTDIVPTLAELCGIEFSDVHGRSLVPILTENGLPWQEREFVRCEYYDSCWGNGIIPRTYGTMYRDKRYKLNVYHGVKTGELYDMEADPDETHNLWYIPEYQELKYDLMKKSFDASVIMQRPGQVREHRY